MLVLAAAELGIKELGQISARTRRSVQEVRKLVLLAKRALWLRTTGSLTRLGRDELARLRKRRRRTPVVPTNESAFYYPTQLRAP
jgi:hypothetical protein